MSTVESRVRAGAMLLDSCVVGWAGKIDVSRLDLNDCLGCILGQCFDLYGIGKKQLGLSHQDAVDFGFHADDTPKAARVEYMQLTPAWLAEIALRLAEAEEARVEAQPQAMYASPRGA